MIKYNYSNLCEFLIKNIGKEGGIVFEKRLYRKEDKHFTDTGRTHQPFM